jgi:hypothetical protein
MGDFSITICVHQGSLDALSFCLGSRCAHWTYTRDNAMMYAFAYVYSLGWRVKRTNIWKVRNMKTNLRHTWLWNSNLAKDTDHGLKVKIEKHIIIQVARFKYFGSNIENDDTEIEDVNLIIHIGCWKQRNAFNEIYDRKVPLKFKRKFYSTYKILLQRRPIEGLSHKISYDKKISHEIESWGISYCRKKIEAQWEFKYA